MPPAAIIRTDIAPVIGTGHYFRCRALAEGLFRRGFEIHWIMRKRPGASDYHRAIAEWSTHWLKAPAAEPDRQKPQADSVPPHLHWLGVPLEQDLAETRAVVDQIASPKKVLIVDHYALDRRFHEALCSRVDCVLAIDDLADRALWADFVLDSNYGRNPADYSSLVPPGTRVLTGPSFALLRPEFARLRESSVSARANRPIHKVLISLGGADRSGATTALVRAMLPLAEQTNITLRVLVGGLSNAHSEVSALAQSAPKRIQVDGHSDDFAQILATSDLAIGAVGMSTWERCALGVPSLHVILAENQRRAAMALSAAEIAPTLGTYESLDADAFGQAIRHHLKDERGLRLFGTRSAAICDGLGVERVAELITDRISAQSLRPATV